MIYILESYTPIWKKEKPDAKSRSVGIVRPGELVPSTEMSGTWIKTTGGWVNTVDSKGKPILISDHKHVTRSSVKLDSVPKMNRVFYDQAYGDETEKPSEANYFPETSATWMEGQTKVTVTNNGDGTYLQQRVTPVQGGEQIDSYQTDANGNINISVFEGPQINGHRNSTTITADGTKVEVIYDDTAGTMTTTTYNPDGIVASSVTEPIYGTDMAPPTEETSEQDSILFNEVYDTTEGYNFGKVRITDTYGIFGIPYQYMETVDRVLPGSTTGRMYLERVIGKMPLLFIAPGEPRFLGGYDEDSKRRYVEGLLRGVEGAAEALGSIMLDSTVQTRFYVFENQWAHYRQYVQPLIFTAAILLGIDTDIEIPEVGKIYASDWAGFTPLRLASILNAMNGCSFYINSEVSISDNFTNSTDKSQLEQKVNQFSDLAKEIQFLLGSAASMVKIDLSKFVPGGHASEGAFMNAENASELTENILGRGNFLEAIAGNLATVVQGGKLIFPEIWKDSSYNKSYSVEIKLRCPDGDKLSWFLNIWVPIAHLLPLVLPKAAGANGYLAPFLVRCWYKGLFHCPMGIITSMSIRRGEVGNWTLDGLPMSVDISLEIKDLYSTMAISRRSSSLDLYAVMENIGIMDFISNFCGVNINEHDFARTCRFLLYSKLNLPQMFMSDLSNRVLNSIQNAVSRLSAPTFRRG